MSSTPTAVGKVLSANDLGLTGSHQGGMVVPRSGGLLGFFPPLDPDAVNPEVFLHVSVPELDSSFRLRFVYYNSRRRGEGTRNEFRLTGLARMLRELGAKVGDEVLFRRELSGAFSLSLGRAGFVGDASPSRGGWRLVLHEEGN